MPGVFEKSPSACHEGRAASDNRSVEADQAKPDAQRSLWIAEPRVRKALRRYFEKRAPGSDVDDLVQTTLAEALASERAPAARSEWDLWLYGIAHHKLADHFRRRRRESPLEDSPEEAAAESAHHGARELLDWAERELPESDHAQTTLEALLEEADGESLESLARARSMPPARLRQRAVRLREHFRVRWATYLAVLGVLGVVAVIAVRQLMLVCCAPPPIIVEDVPLPPAEPPRPELERGRELRRAALERCRARAFEECLKGLAAARELDPDGDTATEVVEQRAAARRALEAPPAPSSSAAPLPTTTSPRSTPPAPTSEAPARPVPRRKTTQSSSLSEPSLK